MKGLLDPAICERGETLVLIPCKSIHTFGMTEAIDVAFVDRRGRVLDVVRGLPPRRVLSCQRATCVLERRSAACGRWVEQGEAMTFMAGAAGSEWL